MLFYCTQFAYGLASLIRVTHWRFSDEKTKGCVLVFCVGYW